MQVLTRVDPAEIVRLLTAGTFVWIDLEAPEPAEVEAAGDLLGLHPLAVEDTRDFGQRPKVDRYGDAVLAVVFAARSDAEGIAHPVEVHLHASQHFLLTVRPGGGATGLSALHGDVARHPPAPEDATVYRVLDTLADTLGPALERQQAELDALADAILQRPRSVHLQQLVTLKRSTAALRRALVAQHERFGQLEGAVMDLPGLEDASRPYLRDVGDHIAHAAADATAQAAVLDAMTDTYFNANANRLTVVSERLTVIATILLPLTFVTSFFGQNFGWLVDRIDTERAFLVWGVGGLLVPLLVAVGYLLVRRRELA